MADELGPLGWMGVRFFGRMSASISHEIKNVLAIINENAGLLDDFALMAEKGMPLDPRRLGKVAESLMKQVRRADAIVRNMNKFAHSVDDFEKCCVFTWSHGFLFYSNSLSHAYTVEPPVSDHRK